jgi:hypothetical protein
MRDTYKTEVSAPELANVAIGAHGGMERWNRFEKFMRMVVEHAGAERGLLILLRGDKPQIEAEATTGHGRARVSVRQAAITPSNLPQSALHYVIRILLGARYS